MKLKAEKSVRWTEDTIDNENMNKRKSKSKLILTCNKSCIVCCIFEKQKTHPDDTSSSSCCSSDSDHGHNNYDKFPKHQRRAMRKKK